MIAQDLKGSSAAKGVVADKVWAADRRLEWVFVAGDRLWEDFRRDESDSSSSPGAGTRPLDVLSPALTMEPDHSR